MRPAKRFATYTWIRPGLSASRFDSCQFVAIVTNTPDRTNLTHRSLNPEAALMQPSEPGNSKAGIWRRWAHGSFGFIALTLVGFCVYGPTLRYEMIFDDILT